MAEPPQILDKPDRGSGGAHVDRNMLLDSRSQGTRFCGKQDFGRTGSCANDSLMFPESIGGKLGFKKTTGSPSMVMAVTHRRVMDLLIISCERMCIFTVIVFSEACPSLHYLTFL